MPTTITTTTKATPKADSDEVESGAVVAQAVSALVSLGLLNGVLW